MSEFKPNELVERRAEEKGDSILWTPVDALLACLRDIENGEINPERLVIHFTEMVDEDRHFNYYASNVTTMEHVGMLAIVLGRITAPN